MPRTDPRKPWPDRFWSKVDMSGGPDQCWPWLAGFHGKDDAAPDALGRKGRYGAFRLNMAQSGSRGYVNAHRVAWELANDRAVPKKMQVCHSCDYRPCCNPAHLFLGTPADNMRDCRAKGRMPLQVHLHRHPGAKLTDDQIQDIKAMLATGLSQRAIGENFGVSQSAISEISRGIRYKPVGKIRIEPGIVDTTEGAS